MQRKSLVWAVLLGACHHTPPAATESLGQTHYVRDPSKLDPVAAKRAAATLEFRKSYLDPGGMWLPAQMTLPQHVENFAKLGVAIDPKELANPLGDPLAAVVQLNGCTGSFVSNDGLIVTNHHCVQRALQQNSTTDANLVESGVMAKTFADERPAGPTQRVLVVQSYKDVTKAMRDGLDAIKDAGARKEEVEKREKALIAACERGKPSIRCSISRLFAGGMYQLVEALEIRDVRVVYVPARAVGNFGGEVDNWHWPRHTGDWSFFRAYVGKNGAPADQLTRDGKLADNVPYHPKHWLKVAPDGLHAADFVMVPGFPGRTSRLATAMQIHHDVEYALPYDIELAKQRYAIYEEHAKDAGETGIKAGVEKQSTQNRLAKNQGVLAGLQQGELLAQKDALDKQIKDWAAQPGHEAHATAIAKLEAMLAEQYKLEPGERARRGAFEGSRLLGTALSLAHWADQRAKPDAERKPGYQDRDTSRATASAKQFAKGFDRTLDRAAFKLALVRALALPDAERPWLATLLDTKKNQKIDEALIEKTLVDWYKAPLLEDEKLRLDLLATGTLADLKASKDPFVKAAMRVWPLVQAQEKLDDARAGDLVLVAPYYADAMREVLHGFVAPDANGTLRISYGTVKPLTADGPAFTTAAQLVQRATGTAPFDAPEKQIELMKVKTFGPYADDALDGELPIDFLSDVDTTNGSSGSPTLNGKGELVGLLFDGTLDGVASDVVYQPATTRSIHVDVRYLLWMLDLVDGGDHLLKEMGVAPRLK